MKCTSKNVNITRKHGVHEYTLWDFYIYLAAVVGKRVHSCSRLGILFLFHAVLAVWRGVITVAAISEENVVFLTPKITNEAERTGAVLFVWKLHSSAAGKLAIFYQSLIIIRGVEPAGSHAEQMYKMLMKLGRRSRNFTVKSRTFF